MAASTSSSSLNNYSLTAYSPRGRPSAMPLWYVDRTHRRRWGLAALAGIAAYVAVNAWLISIGGVSHLMIVLLVPMTFLSAYFMWQGYKLAKHG